MTSLTFHKGNVLDDYPVHPGMCPTFLLTGAPRTKKTSSRLVRIGKFHKIIPSKAHQSWFACAMDQAAEIRQRFRKAGIALPITQPVNVRAWFYRQTDVGDACGYYQALGDWLQEPVQSKKDQTKWRRQGAGIIKDDRQIASWDGSRLLKDSKCPRIEVQIQILDA